MLCAPKEHTHTHIYIPSLYWRRSSGSGIFRCPSALDVNPVAVAGTPGRPARHVAESSWLVAHACVATSRSCYLSFCLRLMSLFSTTVIHSLDTFHRPLCLRPGPPQRSRLSLSKAVVLDVLATSCQSFVLNASYFESMRNAT